MQLFKKVAIILASLLLLLGAVRRFQSLMLLAIDDNLIAIALIMLAVIVSLNQRNEIEAAKVRAESDLAKSIDATLQANTDAVKAKTKKERHIT